MKMKPDKKKPMEQRGYQFEVRAEKTEKGDVITGRPIVYDSKTDMGYFEEIIEKDALEGTDLTDVRFLVNHDVSKIPLARSRRNNGSSTMQLTVDKETLQWLREKVRELLGKWQQSATQVVVAGMRCLLINPACPRMMAKYQTLII